MINLKKFIGLGIVALTIGATSVTAFASSINTTPGESIIDSEETAPNNADETISNIQGNEDYCDENGNSYMRNGNGMNNDNYRGNGNGINNNNGRRNGNCHNN